jgi:hypothetical protein
LAPQRREPTFHNEANSQFTGSYQLPAVQLARKANITRIGHFDNPPEAQNSRQLLLRGCV